MNYWSPNVYSFDTLFTDTFKNHTISKTVKQIENREIRLLITDTISKKMTCAHPFRLNKTNQTLLGISV